MIKSLSRITYDLLFDRSVVDNTIVDRSNVDEKAHMFDLHCVTLPKMKMSEPNKMYKAQKVHSSYPNLTTYAQMDASIHFPAF